MPSSILIVDQATYTTRNRAKRFIRDGKAKWTDAAMKAIEFLPHYHLSRSYQPPSLDVVLMPAWQPCYHTQGAPAIGPWAGGSPDWFDAYRT